MMRTLVLVAAALVAAVSVDAFVVAPNRCQRSSRRGVATTMRWAAEEGAATRKEQLGGALQTLGLVGLGTAFLGGARPANAAGKAEYLTEPTEEFKEMQAKAMAFEKAAYEKKKVWKARFEKLTEAKTEPQLVEALDNLTKFVLEERGLPIGVKKQDLVTDIRKIKRVAKENKAWTKDVEISYEQLIYSVNYQQSPNTARNLSNPL